MEGGANTFLIILETKVGTLRQYQVYDDAFLISDINYCMLQIKFDQVKQSYISDKQETLSKIK